VAGNPRVDELRKKLDKEPGSRLFAQLAEELRKDGEFEEAIGVAREGLQKHPNYPSARLTLGRALYDTGEWAAARSEFEQVLKGAPDNILASRLLAESLENLGDTPGAVARYKKTLALAPGDKQVMARLEALEGGGSPAAVPASAPAAAPAPVGTGSGARPAVTAATAGPAPVAPEPAVAPPVESVVPAPPPPPPPIKVAEVDTPMELESAHERSTAFAPPPSAPAASAAPSAVSAESAASAPVPSSEPAPIPLAAADEDFELERAYEPAAPSRSAPASDVPPRPAPEPPPARAAASPEHGMMEFEFEPGHGGTIPFAPPPAVAPAASVEVVVPPAVFAPPTEAEAIPAVPTATAAYAPPEPTAAPDPEPPPPAEPPPAPSPSQTVEVAPEAPVPAPVHVVSPVAEPEAPPSRDEWPLAMEDEHATPEPAVAVAPQTAGGELMSPTLAELYFNQGFTDKAVEVYRQLAERDPGNDRLRRRLAELQGIGQPFSMATPVAAPAQPVTAPDPSDRAARRVVLERTIARLEGMLASMKKG
jgi:Tetratricopeptide repeat